MAIIQNFIARIVATHSVLEGLESCDLRYLGVIELEPSVLRNDWLDVRIVVAGVQRASMDQD
jgi:hypothetical protein